MIRDNVDYIPNKDETRIDRRSNLYNVPCNMLEVFNRFKKTNRSWNETKTVGLKDVSVLDDEKHVAAIALCNSLKDGIYYKPLTKSQLVELIMMLTQVLESCYKE